MRAPRREFPNSPGVNETLRSDMTLPIDTGRPPWPFEKTARNLSVATRARRCVLLTNGALNPAHLGHFEALDYGDPGIAAATPRALDRSAAEPGAHHAGEKGLGFAILDCLQFAGERQVLGLCLRDERVRLYRGEGAAPSRWPRRRRIARAEHAGRARFPDRRQVLSTGCRCLPSFDHLAAHSSHSWPNAATTDKRLRQASTTCSSPAAAVRS